MGVALAINMCQAESVERCILYSKYMACEYSQRNLLRLLSNQ